MTIFTAKCHSVIRLNFAGVRRRVAMMCQVNDTKLVALLSGCLCQYVEGDIKTIHLSFTIKGI